MPKRQYFGHLMLRADSLEKTLMLGKTDGERRGWYRMRCLDSINDSTDMSRSKIWDIVKDSKPGVLQSMGLQRVGHDLETEQTKNQTWMWLTQVLNQSMNSLGKNTICFSLRKGNDVIRDNPNYIASSTSKDICFHYQDKRGQMEGQSLEGYSTNSRSSGISWVWNSSWLLKKDIRFK